MSAAATSPATTRGSEDDVISDHLRCSVCLDAPSSNAQKCHNGHILCGEEGGSLSKLRTGAQGRALLCPICRILVPVQPNRCLPAEHTMALLPAACRHCRLATTRGALALHEKSCPSNPEAVQQGKNKALLLAAAYDDLATVAAERLIAGGAEVDAARAGDGFTPLHIASKNGNVAMVEQLIAAWGGVNIASTVGFTPSYLAVEFNRLDVLKLLLAGADVHKASGKDGFTPLHIAADHGHAGIVSMLVEAAGVDLNAALTDGKDAGLTPLFIAARDNRLDVMKLRMAAGADVDIACVDDGFAPLHSDGFTPLHIAAEEGHTGVVTLLLAAGADVNKVRFDDRTPLHKAAYDGRAGVVSTLLEDAGVDLNAALAADGQIAGGTPYVAAQQYRLAVVKLLLAAGADVNKARVDGRTPLQEAAYKVRVGVVSVLLEAAGVDLNAALTDGKDARSTPSYLAAWNNRLDVLKLLIAAGADVHMACIDGFTPLHKSVNMDHAGIVAVLIETAGVDVNAAITDSRDAGVAPLYLAARHNRVDALTLLLAAGADVTKARFDGRTPLCYAAKNNRLDALKLLVAAGADVNKAHVNGWNPLHVAAYRGHADVVDVLITASANVNATALTPGVTPLFVAAKNNRLDALKLLVAAGADVNMARVSGGCTPLFIAAQTGHAGVVDLLIAAGANVHATRTSGATARA
jgi:ankyrin repeat protein